MASSHRTSTAIVALAAALVFGAAASTGHAQATAHYVPGVEGVLAPSLPPPGLYFRDYNQFYTSDRLNDSKGDEIHGADFNSTVYAQVPRLIWIAPTPVLGGNLGIDGLVPLVYEHVKVDTPVGLLNDQSYSMGDPFVGTSLSWHLPQFDFVVGAGEWLPMGNYSTTDPSQAGLGYWTTMLTAGATWFIDTDKTWAVSALNRYEINGEQRDTDITHGQAYTLEWAVSKSVIKTLDLGITGYYQRQMTEDSGKGSSGQLDGAAAVGPEVVVQFPDQHLFLSLRYEYEFWAVNRAQGQNVLLTATYRF
jgi:hypothetical protein